jgi:signal transduction histidine kinase
MIALYRRLYPGINTRILAPFLAMIVVVAGIGIFIVTRLVAGSIEERLNNQLVDSAQAASNAVAEIERQQLGTLRAMAFTEGVDEDLARQDRQALEEALGTLAFNAGLDDTIVYNAQGEILVRIRGFAFSANPSQASQPPDIQNWSGVQRVLAGQADRLGDKFFDIIASESGIILYISAPVYDDNLRLVGGISIGIRSTTFVGRVSSQALSGITFYDNNGAVIGSTLSAVPAQELPLTPDQATLLLASSQERAPIERRLWGGESYQVLYAPLRLRQQSVGLMAVSLPNNFITDRIGTSRNIFALLFTVLFVGIFLLGLVVSRSIIRPVQRLVATSQAIRSGDLTQRVGLGLPDELGELSSTFDDMTEKLVERNTQINELYLNQLGETARRDAILSSINDPVFVLSDTGIEILTNLAATNLMTRLRHNQKEYEHFLQLMATPQQFYQPEIINLGERFYSLLTRPVQMQTGELLGYVIIFHDLTAILEAERVKDEIILQLSHELRTPLTSARGYIELIRMISQLQPPYNEAENQYAAKGVGQLTTLERMINQVIDVSVIAGRRFAISPATFDLVVLVEEVIASLKPDIDAAQQQISAHFSDSAIVVGADRDRLGQALERVIHNAFTYNRPQGCIDVTVFGDRQQVEIIVTDSGLGILPEEAEKIFDRMVRGSASQAGATDARGLGLGLYISREIIQAHNGSIDIAESNMFGTKMRIRLPRFQ